MKKLTSSQRKQLAEWAKGIYHEVDEEELPDVIVDEIFHMGFQAGLKEGSQSERMDLRKIFREANTRIKKSLEDQLKELQENK